MLRISTSAGLRHVFAVVIGLGAAAATADPAHAVERTAPTVVELFTSQGCSSCPPANENVRALAGQPGVLALSFGVTYWDYLGWKDIFAAEEYTDRQRAYVRPLGNSSPFTPQVVVNGRRDVVGNRRGELDALIAASHFDAGAPAVALAARAVQVGAGKAPGGSADVWLVRYDPETIEVPVGRGENGGRTLPHTNVVRDLRRIGNWTGAPTEFPVPAAPKGLRTAVLVQTPQGGPILGAATD